IARALTGLHRKMKADRKELSRYWAVHVADMAQRLFECEPALPGALIAESSFDLPDHGLFGNVMPESLKPEAARVLVARTRKKAEPGWTRDFIRFLGVLPDRELFPTLRDAWSKASLRDALVVALSKDPQPEDRFRFVSAMKSHDALA